MHPDFDLPSTGSGKGRSSSITAAFIQAIVSVVELTDADERWREPQKLDLEALVVAELYKKHWGKWKDLLDLMSKAQQVAHAVQEAPAKALANQALQAASEPRVAGQSARNRWY